MTDKNVVDLNIRRAQQRKARGEVSEDPIVRAAEEITLLYGELAGRLDTVQLMAAIALGQDALFKMMSTAIGEQKATQYAVMGVVKASEYSISDPVHYNGPTVFDEESEDGESND